MVDAEVTREYTRHNAWAFQALWDPGLGGAGTTQVSVPASSLPTITSKGQELTIDGLSVVYVATNIGRTIKPQVMVIPSGGADELHMVLTQYTTTDAIEFRHYAPLGIPILATSGGEIVIVSFDAADNGDMCYIMAWGSYTEAQTPIAVDVKSVRFRAPRQDGQVL